MRAVEVHPEDSTIVWLGHLHGLVGCPLCGDPSHLGPLLAVHLHGARREGHAWQPLYQDVYTTWRGVREGLPAPAAMAALLAEIDAADLPAAGPPPADFETALRQRVAGAARRLEEALARLARFHLDRGRPDPALAVAERLLRLAETDEQRAAKTLGIGGVHEERRDIPAAAEAYRQVLRLAPTDPLVWYFGHNNLGYCLIQLGRCADAEPYCRQAIAIDPTRHNAHKNLGLALAGQGQALDAARSLLTATEIWPQDRRALGHLEALLVEHPDLLAHDAPLAARLAACRGRAESRK